MHFTDFFTKLKDLGQDQITPQITLKWNYHYTDNHLPTQWLADTYAETVLISVPEDVARELWATLRAAKYVGVVTFYFGFDQNLIRVDLSGKVDKTIWRNDG